MHDAPENALNSTLLSSIAKQMMTGSRVKVGEKSVLVRRTSVQHPRAVPFEMNGRKYQAIEHNPVKPSRWGQQGAATRLSASGKFQFWR